MAHFEKRFAPTSALCQRLAFSVLGLILAVACRSNSDGDDRVAPDVSDPEKSTGGAGSETSWTGGDNQGSGGLVQATGGGLGFYNEDPECLQIDRSAVRYVPPSGVEVAFRVLDCEGNAIRPLTPEDVTIINDLKGEAFNASTEGGSASPVTSNSNIQLFSVLALDLSNSIVEGGRLPDVVAGARQFIEQVITAQEQPELRHHVAILGFGSTAKTSILQSFTNDAATLNAALDSLDGETGRGTTNLYGAYTLGLNELAAQGEASAVVERFLILVTDGAHEAGDDANQRAQALGVKHSTDATIFTLAVETPDSDQLPLRELAGRGGAASGACETDGSESGQSCAEFVDVDDVEQLEEVFGAISQRAIGIARSNYRVGVCTPVELGDASLTVEVTIDGSKGSVSASESIPYATESLNGDVSTCDVEMAAAIAKGPLACGSVAGLAEGVCLIACANQQCGSDYGFDCGTCQDNEYCTGALQCETCDSSTPNGCGSACYDFASDKNNCGACGSVCPSTSICEEFSCQCPGSSGELCNGTCAELFHDKENCGACENECVLGCNMGECLTVIQMSLGWNHACALVSDRTVRCWGADWPAGTVPTSPQPVTGLGDVIAVSSGSHHTCALDSDGGVSCWGQHGSGQLGSPVGITGTATPTPVPGLGTAVAISAGLARTCAVLTDGTARCWGLNAYGALGDGTKTNRTSPVVVSGLVDVATIQTRNYHSCALLKNGTVSCWGQNGSGGVGGDLSEYLTPRPVQNLTNVSAISLGNSNRTCALRTDGTVYCWGLNMDESTPTPADPNPTLVEDVATATGIATGASFDCFLLADGAVKCRHNNFYGQLGDGSGDYSAVPVAALTSATAVYANENFACAIRASGIGTCWGRNESGQIGNGTITDRQPVPLDVVW